MEIVIGFLLLWGLASLIGAIMRSGQASRGEEDYNANEGRKYDNLTDD